MTIRTRFAPSPTGYLHIGGVRTALFCYLFAKKHNGQFILRIDDTDQMRNVDEALSPILEGLKWLGIDWDEGPEIGGPFEPYYQSKRLPKYQAAVEKLLQSGFAYRDYARPEELQAERETAQAEKQTFVYSRRFMAETEAQQKAFEAEGRQAVVRLKMPREGKLIIHDLIRGDVEFDWAMEQDHVIQRADGSCLYHLANVVDDDEFQITHVIRAEEHLSNTPRQIFIAQSLGIPLPIYAHLPVVAEPGSKTKLSKRKLDKYLKNKDFAKLVEHGKKIADQVGLITTADEFNPVIVDFYRLVGYLPEAIDNYMALLGWSLDDKTEFFNKDNLIDLFSLDRINKAPASFDPAKLIAFQERHMSALSLEEKYSRVLRYLIAAGLLTSPMTTETSLSALPDKMDIQTPVKMPAHPEMSPDSIRLMIEKLLVAAGDRIKVSGDILDFGDFFADDLTFPIDEKVFEKRIKNDENAVSLLKEFEEVLEKIENSDFSAEMLEQAMQIFLEQKQIKASQVIHALRVAVTGKGVGLGMFETLAILGKTRTIIRIHRVLNKVFN
ncbi:MAG: glutamate--tRNA ligase [Planctomycetia bacterium]|nr:glutamate--tRNA ligase [Planctomycetia bacterium]